ncbi:GlmU family protein [candidate division KSB1 bacterium]
MKLCIYEDQGYGSLYPATYLRPVYDLRCGFSSLKEKIISCHPDLHITLHCREDISKLLSENCKHPVNKFEDDDYLFINGRVLYNSKLDEKIDLTKLDFLYFSENTVAAAVISAANINRISEVKDTPLQLKEIFPEFISIEVEADLIDYPWDLIYKNSDSIVNDFRSMVLKPVIKGRIDNGVYFVNENDIYIAETAVVKPGVVIDAEEGPVYIDDGVRIMPNAVIQGPAYIGKQTLIKAGARISGGTSIGDTCKVGGEIDSTIIQGYSNKQHDGFLGHSYLGEWVNIGADTNNSDLKNNYSSIKVIQNGRQVDTGKTFFGMIMGDHSKTGINTMFNTGTIVGSFCNIFGSDFPPKFIPSFTWGGKNSFQEYDLNKALETAKIVMSRRNLELSAEYECLISRLYRNTADDRASFKKQI